MNRRDPFSFRLRSRFEASRLLRLGMLNNVADVACLLFQHVGEVSGQTILRDAHVEAVGEAGAIEAVQRLETVRPVLSQSLAATTVHLDASATGVCGSYFETGAIDDAVNLVLDSVKHQALLGDAIDASTFGIHELHVRAVKG